MGLFSIDELKEIRAKAVGAGLALKRDALFAWFPPQIQANLPGWGAPPQDALTLDLAQLNQWSEPFEGSILLSVWLREAAGLMVASPSLAAFFDERAQLAAKRAAEQPAAAPPLPPAVAQTDVIVPERMITGTLLPSAFIDLAPVRARSVARLMVPQREAGAPVNFQNGQPKGVFGTGWLIGPKHVITLLTFARSR